MASQITPPPLFLIQSGGPSFEWEDWLEMFDNCIMALDGQGFSRERKKALLLNALGCEGQHIFKYLPIPFVQTVNLLKMCISRPGNAYMYGLPRK